jgi:hypothetical protein
LKLADLFKNTGDSALNTSIAVRLFGRGVGQDLITAMSQGGESLQKFIDKIIESGIEINKADAEIATKFHNSLNTLKGDIGLVADKFGLLLQPAFTLFFDLLGEAVLKNKDKLLDWGASIVASVLPSVLGLIKAITGIDFSAAFKVDPAKTDAIAVEILRIVEVFKFLGTSIAAVFSNVIVPAFGIILTIAQQFATALNNIFGTQFNGLEVLITAWAVRSALAFVGLSTVASAALAPVLLALAGLGLGFVAVNTILNAFTTKKLTDEISALQDTFRQNHDVDAYAASIEKLRSQIENVAPGETDALLAAVGVKPVKAAADDASGALAGLKKAHEDAQAAAKKLGDEGSKSIGQIATAAKQTGADVDVLKNKITDLTPGQHTANPINLLPGESPIIPANSVENVAKIKEMIATMVPAPGAANLITYFDEAGRQVKVIQNSAEFIAAASKAAADSQTGVVTTAFGQKFIDEAKQVDVMNQSLQKTGTFITESGVKIIDVQRQLQLARDAAAGLATAVKSATDNAATAGGGTASPQQKINDLFKDVDTQTAQGKIDSFFEKIDSQSQATRQRLGDLFQNFSIPISSLDNIGTKLADTLDQGINAAVSGLSNLGTTLASGLDAAIDGVVSKLAGLPDTIATALNGAISSIGSALSGLDGIISGLADKIANLAAAAANAVSSALNNAPLLSSPIDSAGGGAGGFALGGPVSGPGTGTSDSILAMLSNGEFVVRADGSNLWGALRHFRVPGFAGGGLVAAGASSVGRASASRTLNLTIDGHKFHGLSAPENVAQSLERFSVFRQVTSGGQAPRWKR